MKLGEVLEAYRKANKLSYRDLAKEIGVDHCLLFRLEKAPTAGTESTLKLIEWLLSSTTKPK